MLQVQSLGALAWYVRGACTTGKKARMDIITGFGAVSWPVSPTSREQEPAVQGPSSQMWPLARMHWILTRKIHGQNLLVESIRTYRHTWGCRFKQSWPILQMGKPEIQKSWDLLPKVR